MMRKLSVVLTVVALVAVMATSAFAAPNFGGFVQFAPVIDLDGDFAVTSPQPSVRLNVSGSVSDNVSYYARFHGSGDGEPKATLGYFDINNLLGEGSKLRLGRQSLASGPTNVLGGLAAGTRSGASVSMDFDALSLYGYADTSFQDVIYGQVSYDLDFATVGANVRMQPGTDEDDEDTTDLGFTGYASAKFDGLGSVYGEFGQKPGSEELDIIVVGTSIDAVKDATGWTNFVEFDLGGDDLSWTVYVTKTHSNRVGTTFYTIDGKSLNTQFTVNF